MFVCMYLFIYDTNYFYSYNNTCICILLVKPLVKLVLKNNVLSLELSQQNMTQVKDPN